MKKLTLLLGAALLTCTTIFAQSTPKLFIKAGANLADLKLEGVDNSATDMRIGFHGGLGAHFHLAPEWALQPELLYSQEGAKIENDKVKLDYINIPLMLQYMFDNGFRVEAGPQFGFLVNSKYEFENGSERNLDEQYKTPNVGMGFGVNYLSYSGLGVGARYNLGLSNIGEGSTDIKTRTLQLSLFYMLDPRHKAKSR
ncbi:porin family protein [Flavisolibacter tropicus]|uniref:porin family protein n=1 Tax=Flavisolibacter tropicus TaxID=1492898 RepID=UPI00082E406F|nr:porin family protein [Flavisolibacter tropicus]